MIWAREVTSPTPGARMWQLLYRSETVDGSPTAVSGVVMAPDDAGAGSSDDGSSHDGRSDDGSSGADGATAPPAGGRPVVTFAHATAGGADPCAPSRRIATDGLWAGIGRAMVRAGFVFAATDYQGLGTPGPHPYLVGEAAAHDVLDAARAARRLPGAGASARTVAWGFSQGAHAVLFAGAVAPTYAPDVDLLGVVSVAPPIDLAALFERASSQPDLAGFLWLMSSGFEAAYGDLSLDAIFPGDRLDVLRRTVDEACTPFGPADAPESAAVDPLGLPRWRDLLRDNSPDGPIGAPVLVVHGRLDEIVPTADVEALVSGLCDAGGAVTYISDRTANHGASIIRHVGEIAAWTNAVVAGKRPPDVC